MWSEIIKAGKQLLANLESNNFIGTLAGEHVPFVPRLKATIKLEVDVLEKGAHTLTLFSNNSFTDEFNTLMMPVQVGTNRTAYRMGIANEGGYWLNDIGANYRYKDWTFSAGVRNVFDTLYSTYAHGNYITLAMGRTYFAELKWGF